MKLLAVAVRMAESGDELDGDLESWYESGTPRARGRYRSGKRVGSWQCWDERGDKEFSVTYDQVGTMIDWSTSAETIEEWMRGCVQACPGERLEDLKAADPDRRCAPGAVAVDSKCSPHPVGFVRATHRPAAARSSSGATG